MKRQKILIHVCCASCAGPVVEDMAEIYESSLFFYNPNISDINEYQRRQADVVRYAYEKRLPFYEGQYDVHRWFNEIAGYEHQAEGGKRCHLCFYIRLFFTAQQTRVMGYDAFTTTLTVSPHKDSQTIFSIGRQVAHDTGVPFIDRDFKKNDGFLRSIRIANTYRFYRQKYCGCMYSYRGIGQRSLSS